MSREFIASCCQKEQMITSWTSHTSPFSFRLLHSRAFRRNGRQLKSAVRAKKEKPGDSQSGDTFFSLRFSNSILARSAVAVFGLGFLDAGYSGDWSRIGAISKETEELLKIAAYLVTPLCLFLIAFISDGENNSNGD